MVMGDRLQVMEEVGRGQKLRATQKTPSSVFALQRDFSCSPWPYYDLARWDSLRDEPQLPVVTMVGREEAIR